MNDHDRQIRFCVNNPRTLAERNELIERGYECVGCLGNCTRCFEIRFMEIDRRFIEGESYAAILSDRHPDGKKEQGVPPEQDA